MSRVGWMVVAALLLVGVERAEAQCWDCGMHLWGFEECWIDSCYWTSGAGNSNCSQYGGCGDMQTCDANGPGCEGGWGLVLLDGRAQAGIPTDQAHGILAQADLLLPEQLRLEVRSGAVYLTLAFGPGNS